MNTRLHSGIYAILDIDRVAADDDDEEQLERLVRYVRDAVTAGAVAVQLRTKNVPAHSLYLPTLLAAAHKAVEGRVPIIMNDHLEPIEPFSERAGFGLHVGQDDATPEHVRLRLGDGLLVGLSTHDRAQVERAAGRPVDYIGFGPIRATSSKVGHAAATGMRQLAEVCAATELDVVAIGGLEVGDILAVRQAGARCAAVIGAWLGPDGAPNGPNLARMAMTELVAAWRLGDATSQ